MGFRAVRPGEKASEHGRFGTISPHTSPHPELELPRFRGQLSGQHFLDEAGRHRAQGFAYQIVICADNLEHIVDPNHHAGEFREPQFGELEFDLGAGAFYLRQRAAVVAGAALRFCTLE